ncbi:MAG: hypothetical protein IPJ41_17685 [Phycisphaerales bacterium]|nr:hypothetical protein [Phycisphaerales bacterium]
MPIRLVIRARRRDEPLHRTEEVEAANAEEVGWSDAELASLPDEADNYFDE